MLWPKADIGGLSWGLGVDDYRFKHGEGFYGLRLTVWLGFTGAAGKFKVDNGGKIRYTISGL